ncbi:ATP-grasp fold amidoligase family protein [Priestia endophytica]|uniref:ATP-grasp fold amidoligase family protein n=1 Tax=Priestia endophytica TaxID=135735 RepID=UPI00203E5235|nr:ATP-grasp fold amidoligase family protein [Priestia endophytica]
MPDDLYLKLLFRRRMGHRLNLRNPTTFNEKLQWLKLNDRNSQYGKMVDKYEVRDYISETIGSEYLIPLLGVYNSFDEIDFSSLPNQFVLKCTHDSGGLVICKDKSQLDIDKAKMVINQSLKRDYYFLGREWPYKNIEPRIICEKYMVDESKEELNDYKIMCFNGKAKCTFVCSNRGSSSGLNIDIYDIDWNLMPVQRPGSPNSGIYTKKPKNYTQMIKYAEILAENNKFLRVDFYEINNQLYFGELTFYPNSGFKGFEPSEYDVLFGNWIEL